MIVVEHNGKKVQKIINRRINKQLPIDNENISITLLNLASLYPDSLIIWYDEKCVAHINWDIIPQLFHHKKIMLTHRPLNNYLPKEIGYIEESLFINVNKKVAYPTWQMSGFIGGVSSDILLTLKKDLKPTLDFEYFLLSLAKLYQPLGLLCYSEPRLLNNLTITKSVDQASLSKLFKFVKEHYKTRWVFILFFNLLIYERRILLYSFLTSLRHKRKKVKDSILDHIETKSVKNIGNDYSVDVIIPTIGRKKYLLDFIHNLKDQTTTPKKIIVVEQNPNLDSVSELHEEFNHFDWPFQIKHIFTHQAGACNARNLALKEVESEWVFLADDDIIIESDFIEKSFEMIRKTGAEACTINCLKEKERTFYKHIIQWPTFGSGCSVVKTSCVSEIKFNKKYEFGFGEDADFGMQLRSKGYDVLYFPTPKILHLKAPIGGFRTPHVFLWNKEEFQPKPSPTVMLYRLVYYTKEQLEGYRTNLYFKFYLSQQIKNPISYLKNMNKRWEVSLLWAKKLLQENK